MEPYECNDDAHELSQSSELEPSQLPQVSEKAQVSDQQQANSQPDVQNLGVIVTSDAENVPLLLLDSDLKSHVEGLDFNDRKTKREVKKKPTFLKNQTFMKKVPEMQDGMKDEKVNQRAYWSFGQLLQSFENNDLENAMYKDLPSALNWFKVTYPQYPSSGPWNLYVRIYVFYVLKSVLKSVRSLHLHHENSDKVQDLILACLDLEPLNEMIFTMMIDISHWLKIHEGKMMFTLANQESRLEYFITSWEDILEMPVKTPTKMDINQFSKGLANLRSRTDTYSTISSALDHYFNRVMWIRHQGHFNNQEDVGLRAIKKKIEWILQYTDESVKKMPPSVASISGIMESLQRILNETDEDPFSGVLDAARELNVNLSLFLEKLRNNRNSEIPHVAIFEKKVPYIYEMLNLKREAFNLSSPIELNSKASKLNESLDFSKASYGKDDVLASVDGILVQIDPISERVVNSATEKQAQSEIFITPHPGKYILCKSECLFMGVKNREKTVGYDPADLSLALTIPYTEIKVISKVGLDYDHLNLSEADQDENESISRRKSTVSSLMSRRSKASVIKPIKKKAGGNMAIILGTPSEVFKFFPFTMDEASIFVNCISSMSGISPILAVEYSYRNISTIKSRNRHLSLQYLLNETHPWIETTEALMECISSLTKESSNISFITLERLYHSCRLEKEVAYQAIECIKETMTNANTEAIILKILLVVDRILDKSIMRPGDDLFSSVLVWIKECQETISPFKNPKARKEIDNLLKKCKSFSVEPLVALGEKTSWDYEYDYEFWLMFYSL